MEDIKFKSCPRCGEVLTQSEDERFCLHCGLDLVATAEKLDEILVPPAPPKRKIGSPSFAVTITALAVVAVGIVVLLVSTSSQSAGSHILPTTTYTPWTPPATATLVPTHTPIPSSTTSYCAYYWDQITPDMNGRTVCVYGMVKKLDGTRYSFSDQPNTLFLFSTYEITLSDTGKTLAPGSCVEAIATIHLQDGVPYINVDELIVDNKYQNFWISTIPSDCPSPNNGMSG